jgi:hypothetical protein
MKDTGTNPDGSKREFNSQYGYYWEVYKENGKVVEKIYKLGYLFCSGHAIKNWQDEIANL